MISRSFLLVLACLQSVITVQAQCEAPSVGENRILTDGRVQATYSEGTTLTYKCPVGYLPVQAGGRRSITCNGRQWTELQLHCQLRSCGSPGYLANGRYLTPDGIRFGATATAQCDEGFSIVGVNTRICQEQGWDGRHPFCEEVKCPVPSDIQNGMFEPVLEVYDYGHSVTYSCNKDYTLVGESTIVCSSNGTFPPPPQCLKISCDAPTIKNALRIEGKAPPYKYLQYVRYRCNEGFKMEGSDTMICDVNGWNSPPPECIELSCKAPTIENAQKVEGKAPPYSHFVRYKCKEGFRMEGSEFLICDIHGWNPPPPKCIEISCDAPIIENAHRIRGSGSHYKYSQYVRYECNEGFIMEGSDTLICDVNGWNPPPPECIEPSPVTEETKPTVRVNPQSSVYTGDIVTLSCELQDETGWKFKWYKNDQELQILNSEGQNALRVTVHFVGKTKYKCEAIRKNKKFKDYFPIFFGRHYSDPVTITVGVRPKPVVSIVPDNQVFSGENVTLRCEIQDRSVSIWQYSWYKDTSPSPVSSEQEYRISGVKVTHTGKYTCKGTEGGGSRSSHSSNAVTLTVSDPNGPIHCCVRFQTRPIPVCDITAYTKTDPQCAKPGVIFTINHNHHVCGDPSIKWVKDRTNVIDQSKRLTKDGNGPDQCCVRFQTKPIQVGVISSYAVTDFHCAKSGVIFTLQDGGQQCGDPSVEWVKDLINTINQRLFKSPT